MIFGLMMFQLLTGWLGHVGEAKPEARSPRRTLNVFLGCIAAIPIVYALLSQATLVGYLLLAAMGLLAVYFIGSGAKSGDRVQMHRYIAMLLLFLAKILFWGMFEQAGSSLAFFAKDYVDAPFDFTLFQSANPTFIILLAPVFAWLWPRLEERGINPSIPRKFGIALVLVAIGFTTLILAIHAVIASGGKVPWEMLALAYLINTMGELCLSPIGLSMVTKLAAPKDAGLAMGAWFMCTAIGNYVAGVVASVATSGGSAAGISQYAETYTLVAYTGFGFGILLILTAPLINKLMHGIK